MPITTRIIKESRWKGPCPTELKGKSMETETNLQQFPNDESANAE